MLNYPLSLPVGLYTCMYFVQGYKDLVARCHSFCPFIFNWDIQLYNHTSIHSLLSSSTRWVPRGFPYSCRSVNRKPSMGCRDEIWSPGRPYSRPPHYQLRWRWSTCSVRSGLQFADRFKLSNRRLEPRTPPTPTNPHRNWNPQHCLYPWCERHMCPKYTLTNMFSQGAAFNFFHDLTIHFIEIWYNKGFATNYICDL